MKKGNAKIIFEENDTGKNEDTDRERYAWETPESGGGSGQRGAD